MFIILTVEKAEDEMTRVGLVTYGAAGWLKFNQVVTVVNKALRVSRNSSCQDHVTQVCPQSVFNKLSALLKSDFLLLHVSLCPRRHAKVMTGYSAAGYISAYTELQLLKQNNQGKV